MSNYSLTEKEKQFFLENGYFGPFRVYERNEAEDMWEQIFASLLTEKSKVYDPNKYHYDRHLDIDLLTDHVMNQKILQKVASLIGEDVALWRTEVFSKSPGDKGTEWHQVEDFAYANNKVPQIVPTEKTDWGIVLTVWTAWSDCNMENGCLKFQPGSHKEMYCDESKDFEKHFDLKPLKARTDTTALIQSLIEKKVLFLKKQRRNTPGMWWCRRPMSRRRNRSPDDAARRVGW
jgi:non-heme Fe2+,alpha-ketoglutarate-dependent halogenase